MTAASMTSAADTRAGPISFLAMAPFIFFAPFLTTIPMAAIPPIV